MARRKKTSKRKLNWSTPKIKKIKIKKRRKYNVWKASYNQEYKKVLAYIRKYSDIDYLGEPRRVENPTLEDIEELKHLHEANKAAVKVVRVQRQAEQAEENDVVRDKCQAAQRAIERALSRVRGMLYQNGHQLYSWPMTKYEHAEAEAYTAIAANTADRGSEEWADEVLANTEDILDSLHNFVFMSKQTWDSNTVGESTEYWDKFFDYVWGIAL